LMSGRGSMWMDDIKFEPVGLDVPTTAANRSVGKPSNLNLSQ
jgi:hypothetical protein